MMTPWHDHFFSRQAPPATKDPHTTTSKLRATISADIFKVIDDAQSLTTASICLTT
jgi:hypothetical protein